MRRWAPVLAVIGLAHGASAGELNPDILRGPVVPSERVAQARAQDSYLVSSKGNAPYYDVSDWTGFYIGGHIGAGTGTAKFADPFGSSIYGDKVTTPGFLAGAQIGYNWQVPNSPWVFGLEGDLDWLDSDGTNTCLAYSGFFVSANCHAQPKLMGDLTGRVGWAYGQFNHSLFYAKGGAAFIRDQTDITRNGTGHFGLPLENTSSGLTKSGWTIGAGVEHAIAPAWSVNLEYDYFDFGRATVATPASFFQPLPPFFLYFPTSAATTTVRENFQEMKLGLNYRFGMDPTAQWGSASSAFPATAPEWVPEWEIELGVRYWYSSGKFQKDLGSTTDPALAKTLSSRLTYKSIANSGEFFGRVEALNVFVKGYIGAGSLSSGHMNDEDWLFQFGSNIVSYSNTLADPVKGNIDYATLDLGYDFFHGAGYKLGGFIGYNYYKENKSAYGCTQIANQYSDCVPADPSSVLGITEDDTWKSFRVGVNGEIMVADRLKLGADVAYLPYVVFDGADNHVQRTDLPITISPESATGRGVQLQAVLSWLMTDQWSVGVGWRYWAMWSTNNAITNFASTPCPCNTLPVKTERDGVFLQATYKFAGTN
jgi:opacity protein-like surface antigen